MNRKLRTVLVALGAEFLFVSLFLMCCSLWETRKAERSVAELLPQVVSSIEEACEQPVTTDENEAGVEIDGNRYLGYLSIPSLELELPVMYEWDYDCLNTSPCRYAGTTKTKDLIIAAHNYSGHFGRVPELSPGDSICLTEWNQVVSRYKVVEIEEFTSGSMQNITSGDYDLTLVDITDGLKKSVAVRCIKEEN
jgi:sortase A